MINNRQQTGRRRGRGGQNGQRQQNGRPEMGNRIDNRARGNAPQLLEKYKTLARDAQQSGDRVLAEYYFQFADHYFRVLAESRARYEEANPNRPRQEYGDNENEGFDGEGNDVGEGDDFDAPRQQQARQDNRQDNRSDQQPRQYRDDRPQREDRPRNDQNRDDRPRNDQPRNDQPRQDREPRPERANDDRPARNDRYQRDDRPRNDQNRDDRPRDDRPRDDRPRDERPREQRPRLDRSRPAAPRAQANGNGAALDDDFDHGNALPFDALPPAIGVSTMEPVAGVEGEVIPVPKKRGRPKKVVTEVATQE